jgi:uncharacterized protein involved in copper resistance
MARRVTGDYIGVEQVHAYGYSTNRASSEINNLRQFRVVLTETFWFPEKKVR